MLMEELVNRVVPVQQFSVSFKFYLFFNFVFNNFFLFTETLACDHTKVTPYFIESINSVKGFYAGPCPNLFSYLLGWCEPKDADYVLMGEHVSRK